MTPTVGCVRVFASAIFLTFFPFFWLCRLLRFVSYFSHIHDIIITLITFFLLSMFFLMNGFGKVSHALPIIPPSHYFLSISLYIRVDMG